MSQSKSLAKAGRPKITDNPDVVSLLVTSFQNGLNVRQACWQSGISHEAFYTRMRDDSTFADTMARAQQLPSIGARIAITAAIKQGDVSASKWWLERRDTAEFDKQNNEASPVLTNTKPVLTEEELTKIMARYKQALAYQYKAQKLSESTPREVGQAPPSSVTALYQMSDDEVLEIAQEEGVLSSMLSLGISPTLSLTNQV